MNRNRINRKSSTSEAGQYITVETPWGTCDRRLVVYSADGSLVDATDWGNDQHGCDRAYFKTCEELKVDAQPEYTKATNLQNALIAVGWVHVHTWQEGHGNYSTHTLELPASNPGAPVQQLHIDIHRDAEDETQCYINRQPHGSYLLAKHVQDVTSGNSSWLPLTKRSISPCCTSGSRYFVHRHYSDSYVQVTSVAGHGEWANYITLQNSPETHRELSGKWTTVRQAAVDKFGKRYTELTPAQREECLS